MVSLNYQLAKTIFRERMDGMLNKRLVRAVPESKKYIAGNVLCQWVSLLANIRLMAALTALVAALPQGKLTAEMTVEILFDAVVAVAVRAVCT